MFLRKGAFPRAVVFGSAAVWLFFLFSCSQEPDPVSRLSEKWLETETALFSYVAAPGEITKTGLTATLGDFSVSFEDFTHSPLFDSLAVSPYSPVDIADRIRMLLEELSVGNEPEWVMLRYLLIGKEVSRLQQLNVRAADAVHMTYFSLFYVLLGVFICMVLVLWRLNSTLEHSLLREKQSAVFSRDIILAQERERSRISRELHDTVAQDLRYIGLQISQINRNADTGELKDLSEDLIQKQETLLGRIRSICADLIPPDFNHQSLSDALGSLCHDFGEKAGLECRIAVQEPLQEEALPAESLLQCFRLVQEALNNIEKHARAREAAVVLRNAFLGNDPAKPSLLICISDDGLGFAHPPTRENSFKPGRMGIRGMYERITILGGKLDFISASGEGTMVRIEIPYSTPV